MKRGHKFIADAGLTVMVLFLAVLPASAEPPAPGPGGSVAQADKEAAKSPQKPLDKPLKLPGLVIDTERRCVDVDSVICLDDGSLELIACTKGTKEHESIVTVEARPIHIHTALLLLGASSGNPAMRRAIDEEGTRWMDVPPKGDSIDVFLVIKDSAGKSVERPISDFIVRSEDSTDGATEKKTEADPANRFPHTFIFAGSQLVPNGNTSREYLAETSGNVISMVSFGDELLCLPDFQSHENGALMWRIDSTHLPKLGSKVTLRLKVRKPPATKPAR